MHELFVQKPISTENHVVLRSCRSLQRRKKECKFTLLHLERYNMSSRPIIHSCIVCDYDDFLSFQVMDRNSTALVISPLRALCLDQVSFLRQHNVLACWLNPEMDSRDRQG